MQKIFKLLVLVFFSFLLLIFIALANFGIETNKFNNVISKQINQSNKNIELELNSITFKLDIKQLSLFLETDDTQVRYRGAILPTDKIKVYVDFISLLKSKPNIKKIDVLLNQLEVNQLKKFTSVIKPSNFKNILVKNITKGELSIKIEVYFDKKNLVNNFIAKGSVSNLEAKVFKNHLIKKTNFNFFADRTDVLIKNIDSVFNNLNLKNGDLKLNLSPNLNLVANFDTNIKLDEELPLSLLNKFKNLKYFENIKNFEAELENNLSIKFDETYKAKQYELKSRGKILNAKMFFEKPLNNFISREKIDFLSIINTDIETNFTDKNNFISLSGEYSIEDDEYLNFDLDNSYKNDNLLLKINSEYSKDINIEFLNYKKNKDSIANISVLFEKNRDKTQINELEYKNEKNLIQIKDLILKDKKLVSLNKALVKTYNNDKLINDFNIDFKNKFLIKGKKFDATNLPKLFNKPNGDNNFSLINNDIEIDIAKILAPMSKNLVDFKLIGKIKNGKFIKISSKGSFGNNNYLDISMKSDENEKIRFLEIYSDLPQPLLSEYNFFKGLSGGKLLFSSAIKDKSSISSLNIEDFKVVNAPGMIKLLSLADLGGLADLAKGEGLSFDTLEISLQKENDFLTIKEILALGPSISVLMEGYQDASGLTSLRGTLVPAKTLNTLISRIPVIGDIIIPKEAGEGLFGISFKMKGPPGKIKTTINPIKTLTPRFLQKIIKKS